jgi:predicted ATPase
MNAAPYLVGVSVVANRIERRDGYPFTLPFVSQLDLRFESPVTFFVGENGTGKSTLLEAIASLCRLPVSGGGRNELAARHGPDAVSPLAPVLRPAFRRRPPDAYFLRAELQAHLASLLDTRRDDPEFLADPYGRYGGQSLHTRSHGEAFLAILEHRIQAGLFLLDEPESALSPQRQLVLLAHMWAQVAAGKSQFIVATHSPILLTFPGADLVTFDGANLARVRLEDTSHYQITRGILHNAESYWKHLRG